MIVTTRFISVMLFCFLLNMLTSAWKDYVHHVHSKGFMAADVPSGLMSFHPVDDSHSAIPWIMIVSLALPVLVSFLYVVFNSESKIEAFVGPLLACVVILMAAFHWTRLMSSIGTTYYRTWIEASFQRERIALAVVICSWAVLESALVYIRWRRRKLGMNRQQR